MFTFTGTPGAKVRSEFCLRKNFTDHREGKSRPGRYVGRKQRAAIRRSKN